MLTDVKANELIIKREQIKQVLFKEVYGALPDGPAHLTTNIISEEIDFAAGKATFYNKNLVLDMGSKNILIPFVEIIPNGKADCPAIVYLDYDKGVPNKYLPAEEIIDRGYAIFSLDCKLVSENNGDFKSKISADIARSRRKKNAPGKLMLWAWAAIRLIEYAASVEVIDEKSLAVAGHGLYGKAALLAGALCDEANYIIANDSISFGSVAQLDFEKISLIMPHLFCPSFEEKNNIERDQAMLLSLCAPKNILVGSASDDPRSAPELEYEALLEASLLPPKENEIPTECGCIQTKNVSFHIRGGMHYLSREDWKVYLDFIDKRRK